MKSIALFSSVFLLCLIACSREQEQKSTNPFSPVITKAHGYVVPRDSIAEPEVVPAGKPAIVSAGKPIAVLTNTNVIAAGAPKVVPAGSPKIYTPGQDGFPSPITVPAVDCPFVAGVPATTQVKDTYFKDNFPQSNSAFIKLRGLSLAVINCIMKDNSGNIWIGTAAGAARFNGKFYAVFKRKDGLPASFVSSMIQDRQGNIWFGTAGGVCRYDGKYMTNFTDKEGLVSKSIRSLLEDKSGNFWFGCMDGTITRYDGRSFTHFTEEQGLGEDAVMSIMEDENENIWFGTATGLYCYDGNCFKHFTIAEGLSSNWIQRVLKDESGNLWLGTGGNGIICYDGKSFTNYTKKEGLSDDGIWDMTLDHYGNLWFATYAGGVCRFDGKFFTQFTNQKDLVDPEATAIYHDNSGNIWVGGGRTDGLMRYNDVCFNHYTIKEGLSDNEVWSLMKDKDGNIWIGTNRGGVNLYDGKSFTHFTGEERFFHQPVTEIIQDRIGNIWFATWGAGAVCYDGKSFSNFTANEGLISDYLESMVEDKNGYIWFGTDGAGLCRYDGKSFTYYTTMQGLSDNTILSSLLDKDGMLWFGTGFGGVTSYDGETFTHFTGKEGFCNNPIYAIYQDRSNYLWFCTVGKGACRYDGKSFMFLTENEGLKDKNVNGMIQDKSGALCFACGSGLSRLSDDVIFKNYSPEDGFSGWGCNGPICEDNNGIIWISSSDRLTAYDPDKDMPDSVPPNIQITSLQLYYENIPWLLLSTKKDTTLILGNGVNFRNFEFDSLSMWYSLPVNLSLAHNNNYLTLNYLGITPKLSTRVNYKYKLEGLEESWSALTTRTEVAYANLPPGSYTFKVKAMSGEGLWSDESDYDFTIRPPWWKTWWAYSIYVLMFIGGILFIINSFLEKQRKKIRLIIKERNRIARELHDDIGAELTRLTMMSQLLQKKPGMDEEIKLKLSKISETGKKVLGTIGEIIWTMNPQKDNLDGLAAYIRRFVTEYLETNGIDLKIEFPDEIPANDISDEYRRNVFLVIKEAINNITKHSKATRVSLSLKVMEKLAEFEITDNGMGFSVNEKQDWGNGLSNMNQRMKDIGGSFFILSEKEQGTKIRISFPVR